MVSVRHTLMNPLMPLMLISALMAVLLKDAVAGFVTAITQLVCWSKRVLRARCRMSILLSWAAMLMRSSGSVVEGCVRTSPAALLASSRVASRRGRSTPAYGVGVPLLLDSWSVAPGWQGQILSMAAASSGSVAMIVLSSCTSASESPL
jgi:hypothetical protein